MTQTPQHDMGYQQEPGKGLAITSLVTGILGLVACPLVGVLALITGIPAMIGANKQPPTHGGRGFAIAGTVLGGVSLLLGLLAIPLLIAILLPALGQARQAALRVQDASNVRMIGLGLQLYAQDNGDTLPPAGEDWRALLIDNGYAPAEVFATPYLDGAVTGVHSYFYLPAETLTIDARRVLVYTNPALTPDGGSNVAFHDIHVETVDAVTFQGLTAMFVLPDGTAYVPHIDEEMP